MTKVELHKAIDEWWDERGFRDKLPLRYGSVSFQVNIENGKEVIRIRERETVKVTERK